MGYLKLFKKNYLGLLISSIIPLLILGPFFPDLIVSISTILFLYYVFQNKNYYYFNNTPFIIFFIFWILLIFSSLLSDNIFFSLKSSFFYFRFGIFICFIWYLIDKDKNFINLFYYSLIICFFCLITDGFYQYLNKTNIFGLERVGGRISSFFGDELVMGSYLSRLFPLLFALFIIKKKNKHEIYFIGALFILTDILIYLSGERTAFVFLNLSTIFIIILIKKYQIFRLVSFLIAVLCITFLSLNSQKYFDRMILLPATNLGILTQEEQLEGQPEGQPKERVFFTPIHDSHFRTAYAMFKEKPVFGHGPKMFRIKCSNPKFSVGKWPCNTHPHNFYLQLLAETGLVGFTFLFSVLCYISYSFLMQIRSILLKKKRHLNDYQVCLLAGILITVWPLSPNGNFFNNWLSIVYCLPAGFYLQSIYSKS